MADRWYRKTTLAGVEVQALVEEPGMPVALINRRTEVWFTDRDELRAAWALIGTLLGDEIPPDWAVGPIPATDVNGDPIEVKRDV